MMSGIKSRPVFPFRADNGFGWIVYSFLVAFALVFPLALLVLPVFVYFVLDAVFKRPAVRCRQPICRFVPGIPVSRAPPYSL